MFRIYLFIPIYNMMIAVEKTEANIHVASYLPLSA